MNFDKPIVTEQDLTEIMKSYEHGLLKSIENLGGIPNTSYKVTTPTRTLAVRIYNNGQSSDEHVKLEIAVLQHLAKIDFLTPHPVVGIDGNVIQYWKGYRVCATEFINGLRADLAEIHPLLVQDVGRVVAQLQKALSSFKVNHIPESETLFAKGEDAIASMPEALERRGWKGLEIDHVQPYWNRAKQAFMMHDEELTSHIIHADTWPPNVLCEKNRVTGLLDFDDCCFGPTVFDVIVPMMEFSMFCGAELDPKLATAFFTGYFASGGKLSSLERSLIADGVELLCAMWFAYNIIQAPQINAAITYLNRLQNFRSMKRRIELQNNILTCIANAERNE